MAGAFLLPLLGLLAPLPVPAVTASPAEAAIGVAPAHSGTAYWGDLTGPGHLATLGRRLDEIGTGSGVTIAVVDSGVEPGRVLDGLEDNVLPGIDLCDAGPDGRSDDFGHGSQVASVLSSSPGGPLGVGIAPAATILPVKVFDIVCDSPNHSLAEGIRWAVDNGADIINVSLVTGHSPALEEALRYAEDHQVLVVAAAGNDPSATPQWPAAFEPAVAVSALTTATALAAFSSTGSHIDLAAPGESILASWAGAEYLLTGTSFATPLVSGALAVLMSAHPDKTPLEIKNALYDTALDLGETGVDPSFGHGLPDLWAAHATLSSTPLPRATAIELRVVDVANQGGRSVVLEARGLASNLRSGERIRFEKLLTNGTFAEIATVTASPDGLARTAVVFKKSMTVRTISLDLPREPSTQVALARSGRRTVGLEWSAWTPSESLLRLTASGSPTRAVLQGYDPATRRWSTIKHSTTTADPVGSGWVRSIRFQSARFSQVRTWFPSSKTASTPLRTR
jgi:subtilisin family serine protease